MAGGQGEAYLGRLGRSVGAEIFPGRRGDAPAVAARSPAPWGLLGGVGSGSQPLWFSAELRVTSW